MTAIERAVAEMENMVVRAERARINEAQEKLYANTPVPYTDKLNYTGYAMTQREMFKTIRVATRKINDICG